MSILAHRISYLTQYNSQKPKTILILQKKEVLNFNLVSEIQPKTKIRTYLFVLKSSCERISQKKEKSQNSFRDYFMSSLSK